MTPLLKQWSELRLRHPGMIVLFRIGDFYETFEDDAVTVSRLCKLSTTTRHESGKPDVTMVGFPHMVLERHLHTLLAAGQRVAIADEIKPETGQ